MPKEDRELVEAVEFHKKGTVERVKQLIGDGADANAKRSATAWRALHWATYHGDEPLMRVLLDAGADVNARDNKDGFAPLHVATREPVAALLLDAGAEVNAPDKKRNTPLLVTVVHAAPGHPLEETERLVRTLIARGADVNAAGAERLPPLHAALAEMPDGVIDALIDAGASPEVDVKDRGTAVHIAASYGRTKAIERLKAGGADLNAHRKGDKWTPLHAAASADKLDVVTALVAAGVDVNAKDALGKTPAHYAHRDEVRASLEKR